MLQAFVVDEPKWVHSEAKHVTNAGANTMLMRLQVLHELAYDTLTFHRRLEIEVLVGL